MTGRRKGTTFRHPVFPSRGAPQVERSSEVQMAFYRGRGYNPRKLHAEDIADAIVGMLAMEDRGFVTEMSVWATNPE